MSVDNQQGLPIPVTGANLNTMKISNVKTQKNKVIITFDYDNAYQFKHIIALSVLGGHFNPMRRFMTDHNMIYKIMQEYKDKLLQTDHISLEIYKLNIIKYLDDEAINEYLKTLI